MLTQVVVTSPYVDEALTLTLARPEASGMAVINVDGLGPVKSSINIRNNSFKSGGLMTSTYTPPRNIVLTLQFVEPYSNIETLRNLLYLYFPNEVQIMLDFLTTNGRKFIQGFVESNEISMFSQNQTCVISIICPDPYFRMYMGERRGVFNPTNSAFAFDDTSFGLRRQFDDCTSTSTWSTDTNVTVAQHTANMISISYSYDGNNSNRKAYINSYVAVTPGEMLTVQAVMSSALVGCKGYVGFDFFEDTAYLTSTRDDFYSSSQMELRKHRVAVPTDANRAYVRIGGLELGTGGSYTHYVEEVKVFSDLINFGNNFITEQKEPIVFDGTIEVEPSFYLMASGGSVVNPSITFYNPDDQNDVRTIKFNLTLLDGDSLMIVCERQNKSVTRYTDSTGLYSNALNSVTLDSAWPVLRPGSNDFEYTADSGGQYIRLEYSYHDKYIGL